MRRVLLLVLLISLLCLTSCFSSPKRHKEIIETYLDGYKLLNIREGNFTHDKGKQYLAFYSEILVRSGIDSDDIDQVVHFVFKNNKIENVTKLSDLWSISYKNRTKEIDASNYADSKWDGSCFAADFNENGIDEFVFFILTGRSFHVDIYEYSLNEGKFIPVLGDAYKEIYGIYKINTIQEDGKNYVMLYGYGNNLPEGHLKWNKCEWSEGKGQYILIDHGSEYFEF